MPHGCFLHCALSVGALWSKRSVHHERIFACVRVRKTGALKLGYASGDAADSICCARRARGRNIFEKCFKPADSVSFDYAYEGEGGESQDGVFPLPLRRSLHRRVSRGFPSAINVTPRSFRERTAFFIQERL